MSTPRDAVVSLTPYNTSLNTTLLFDQLAEKEFAVVDDALDKEIYSGLNARIDELIAENELRQAGVGSASHFELNKKVRGDEIYWLDRRDDHIATSAFFSMIDQLIEALNRSFFLSLSDAEFHFAHYPMGSHYGRHLDQFKSRNNRQISVILYLNSLWENSDGGELKIYRDSECKIIEPIGNRLVLFRSDTIWHEVLKTNKSRKSVTGWLLNNPVGLGFLG